MQLCRTQCCGMRELDNVTGTRGNDRSAEAALEDFFKSIPKFTDYSFSPPRVRPQLNFALVTFTGVVRRRRADQFSDRQDDYGQAFADLIVKEGLGDVVAGPEAENPNTTNIIRCWIWRINKDAVMSRVQKVLDAEEEQKRNDARRIEAERNRGRGAGGTYGDVERSEEPLFRTNDFLTYSAFVRYYESRRDAIQRLDADQILGNHNRGADAGAAGGNAQADASTLTGSHSG